MTWLIIRDYLTPRPASDPLAKNTGFGWGWLLLLASFNYVFQKGVVVPQGVKDVEVAHGARFFMNIASLIIIAFPYFRIRKRIIEKRRYGNNLAMASFIAGVWALLLGAAIATMCSLGLYYYR